MKILIADDNKDLVASLKERLQVAGFTTIEAYEGVRVIELTPSAKFARFFPLNQEKLF